MVAGHATGEHGFHAAVPYGAFGVGCCLIHSARYGGLKTRQMLILVAFEFARLSEAVFVG